MSSKSKGDAFEDRVFSLLPKMISEGDIPVPVNHCFHRGKIYQAGNLTIQTDISIEVFAKSNPSSPSQIIIIECKNLLRELDVSDYEEWIGKLLRFRSSGIKLYIAIPSKFSNPTIADAKQYGFGLIRFSDDESWDLVAPRKYSSKIKPIQLDEQFLFAEHHFGMPVVFECNQVKKLSTVIQEWGLPLKQNHFKTPYLSEEKIEAITLVIRDKIDKKLIDKALYGACFVFNATFKLVSDMPEGFLGGYNPNTRCMLISDCLTTNVQRMNFTMAHELGHCVLHHNILKDYYSLYAEDCVGDVFVDTDSDNYKRMEWQANTFASYFLMPTEDFKLKLIESFNKYDIRHGHLRLDKQPCNIQDYNNVLSMIARAFDVSKEVVKIRLINLGLLEIINDQVESLDNQIRLAINDIGRL